MSVGYLGGCPGTQIHAHYINEKQRWGERGGGGGWKLLRCLYSRRLGQWTVQWSVAWPMGLGDDCHLKSVGDLWIYPSATQNSEASSSTGTSMASALSQGIECTVGFEAWRPGLSRSECFSCFLYHSACPGDVPWLAYGPLQCEQTGKCGRLCLACRLQN